MKSANLLLANFTKSRIFFSMSSENEIEEIAMEMQAPGGTEPVTEQTMVGDSPLRTITGLFGW